MQINYYEEENLWNRELTSQERERLNIVFSLLPNDVKTILDAGCGSGAITNFFNPEKFDITGIDISENALKYYKHKKIKGSLSNIPFPDNYFDLVICSDVLEHIPEDEFYNSIRELKRVARKYILLISPINEDLEANQTKCWNCNTVFHINWHIRSFNIEELINLFREEYSPVYYTFFGDIWSSEPKLKYKIKRSYDEGYLNWEYAICPLCGAKQDKRKNNSLKSNLDKILDKNLNIFLKNFHLSKTEIAILFTKIENKLYHYIDIYKNIDNNSPLILMSQNENLSYYIANRFYINLGDIVFYKNHTFLYPYHAYILKNNESKWNDISEDNEGKFNFLVSGSRALAVFPITDLQNKKLFINVKSVSNSTILKINIYDIEKFYINIANLVIEKSDSKQIITISLPEKINLPSEGVIFEFIVESPNNEVSKINFYDISIPETIPATPVFGNLNRIKKINFFYKELILYTANQNLSNDEIIVFSHSNIYLYNKMLKCFEILNESIYFNSTFMDINNESTQKEIQNLLHKIDEVETSTKKEIQNLLHKIDEVETSTKKEIQNLLHKINNINSNLEKLIFFIKNPHKYLYRKLSSKISLFIQNLKRYYNLKDKFKKKLNNKFQIIILTPDVKIDRRIIQMCTTIVKNFNAQCTIIAALHEEDNVHDKNIIIERVNPYDTIQYSNKQWIPENFNYDLNEFYWLHNQYLNKAFSSQADLFIACDLPVLPAAVIAAKTKNIPVIYDSHELYPEQAVFEKEKRDFLTKVEQYFIKYVDSVITVNESIAEEMMKRYSIQKPHVILNAFNAPEFFDVHKRYDHLRKNLSLTPAQKILLFQGGFSPFRNLENLILSAKYIKEEIIIVLMGFGDYEEKLKNIAISEGLLNKKVFFHPPVSQEKLLEFTASADVGIIPYPHVDLNSYYCTPNKLFEYIQAGLPILANESPELKKFVEGYNIGIIHKLDTEKDIASGINLIFSKDLSTFRDNLLIAREEICWNKEEPKIFDIIGKFINKTNVKITMKR